MTNTKIAVVTGSNKGIGFAIVKGLCEKFQGKVYLTARNKTRGEDAVNKLKKLGYTADLYLLDICNQFSVNDFRNHIKETDGGIDILINNAAIAFTKNSTVPFGLQAKETVKVNYFGTLNVCNALFPLLRPKARVINISSSSGHLFRIPSEELRAKFASPALTVNNLSELMNEFVSSAINGKNEESGWGTVAYIVSKVGLTALTFLQQRVFDADLVKKGISVNAIHPGCVNTDMLNYKGKLSIEQGASVPLYIALESHHFRGQYIWKDLNAVDWYSSFTPPA